MPAARRLCAVIYIFREGILLQTRRTRCCPWPVIGIIDPTGGWIDHIWRFIETQQPLPLCSQVAAVNRLTPVELLITTRYKIGMKIRYIAVRIGIYSVVGRVGMQVHRRTKFL